MKKIFTAHDVTEAHFVLQQLESSGLVVTVRGEDLWGASGELPFVDAWPTIWVLDDACEAEARAVIEQYESGKAAPDAGAPWRCQCGQDLEPQFTTCWSCGKERAS